MSSTVSPMLSRGGPLSNQIFQQLEAGNGPSFVTSLEETPPPFPINTAQGPPVLSRLHHGLDTAQHTSYSPAHHAIYFPTQQAGHFSTQQASLLPTTGNFASPGSLLPIYSNSLSLNNNSLMTQADTAPIYRDCDFTMAQVLGMLEASFPLDHSLTSAPQAGSLDPGNDVSAIFDCISDPSPSALLSDPLDVIFSSDYQSLVTGSSPSPTLNSDMLSRIHPKKRRERIIVDESTLTHAFEKNSPYPNDQLRRLFEVIPQSQFYRDQTLEPRLCSPEASQLLTQARTSELANDAPGKASLFSLFIDRQSKTCLVCNKPHSALGRALGCVRGHLNHRPFACTGCNTCAKSEPARFSTQCGLRDHLSKQTNLDECPKCLSHIRIGGMARHYASRHPDDEVPNMKEERKQRSAASSPY